MSEEMAFTQRPAPPGQQAIGELTTLFYSALDSGVEGSYVHLYATSDRAVTDHTGRRRETLVDIVVPGVVEISALVDTRSAVSIVRRAKPDSKQPE